MPRLSTLSLAASVILPLAHAAPPLVKTQTPGGAGARPVARRKAAPAKVPRIAPSAVFEALRDRKRARPRVTPAELAAYGNSLIAARGFNYHFDSCEVVEANENPPPAPGASERAKLYSYPLRPVGGGAVNFQFVGDFFEWGTNGPCGECFFRVPALRVARGRMLVVADGRRVWLRRPPEFDLDEVQLVDRSLKRVLRTWEVPFQTNPLGLSPDRTKLYIDSWELANLDIEGLAVEISDAGARLVALDQLNLPKGDDLTAFPRDPLNGYLSFKRFGKGRRSYVLRYSAICT